MPYTEADFERMETDPVLARQYAWRVGMNARRMAIQYRVEGRRDDATAFDRLAQQVLDNLDVFARQAERNLAALSAFDEGTSP